ncbi:GNAT family N-acetyltransferase [Actinoplanes sp. NPDC051513]|uniref:GNAT family N-acetyltransferase n=1 Tax=Actinoplanes sp. NPDC051513 TaxID=3363908 RepID=UPI0037ADF284
MHIRSFDWADHDAVIALWWAAGREIVPRAELAAKLTRDPELFLVAAADGEAAGVVMGRLRRPPRLDPPVGGAPRRAGIASALVNELEGRLAALGCPRINLLVMPDNTDGLRFWQARGYLPMPRFIKSVRLGGEACAASRGAAALVSSCAGAGVARCRARRKATSAGGRQAAM